MRKIRLAKTAGFCFGVNRAVEMVEDLLKQGKKVCTLGEIIHNSQLVADLEARGARKISSVEEVGCDEVLVIRSHGVSAEIYRKAGELGIEVVDATCPFVAKIHRIVARESAAGKVIFIAGDAEHSEVRGIAGHVTSGEFYVFSEPEQMVALAEKAPYLRDKEVCMVAQTTFNSTLWQIFQENFKKLYTNGKFFDTICSATSNRQQEAKRLAEECSAMIVIGGRHSSNTVKLSEVCRQRCKNTWHIETAGELKPEMLDGTDDIGVVAGASTPACIIKEVLKQMSENVVNAEINEEQVMDLAPENEVAAPAEEVQQKSFDEMTFEEALEASLNGMNTDQKVKGTVLAVSPTEIQVDIGRKHTGYIPESEYSNDPNAKIMDEVKVGDVLDLILMKTNDQEGTVLLSKRRFDVTANWNTIVEAKENGTVIDGTVSEVIKGGVIVVVKGVRVFIPASQTGVPRDGSLDDLKGQNVSFRIIDIGRRRQAVGSIKSVSREQRKELAEKFWANAAVGDKFNGTVKSLTGFGAFVDLGGVDGLVHISEMSWARIKNPAEVMNVGDTVEVYIKALDTEKKKVSLGYRKPEDNPFVKLQEQYQIGDVVTVKILSLTSYGAFARVIPGVDGLIHISQISNRRIDKPADELSVGQEVEAKIINIDLDKKRVSLSIRALLPEEPAAVEEVAPVEEVAEVAEEAAE